MKKLLLLLVFFMLAMYANAAVNTQYFGKAPNIIVSLSKQEPDPVEPGKQVEVSFKIDNNGTTASNLIFEILPEYPLSLLPGESPSKFIGTLGTSQDGKQSVIVKYKLKAAQDAVDGNHENEAIPFAPIGSSNEKVLSYIEPQATIPIEFELLIDSDAASKAYKVPLNIKYSDVLNKNYSKSNLITIVVGDKPDLGVTLERTEVYTSDSSGSVVLRLVNKGNPDIKFLNVKVLQSENVKVIGADKVYVGKLDSDDFSTAEFRLFVKGKDNIQIPVQVTYKDTNNNNYKENREVELKLYSNSEAKNFGVKKNDNFGFIIIAALVVGLVYYYYKKRKNKK